MTTLRGPVLIVGAGLLGTSIGLALRAQGVDVHLVDVSPENVRTASGLGAGVPRPDGPPPQLVVVAVPPDHLADAVVAALETTDATVTDVGSVKALPLEQVRARVTPAQLARYVGSHPLAGSERSGPLAASSGLFEGRPWAVTPHEASAVASVELVEALVALCRATAYRFSPREHDEAVARTSHLPHVLASLVAGRLAGAPGGHLALSGQGVRDVTRVAAGDPGLWSQILSSNAAALTALLREAAADLDRFVESLEAADPHRLEALLSRGVAGTTAIPGKHGGPVSPEVGVFVAVPDHPGELARMLADVGEIGVNIEDLRIDHDPGRAVGLVELRVARSVAATLQSGLAATRMEHPRMSVRRELHTWSSPSTGPRVPGSPAPSRGVAETLGLRYLDTGAMFRAMTWWMLEHGVDVHDPAAVAARCAEPAIASGTDPVTRPSRWTASMSLSRSARCRVTRAVSHVSVVPEVRRRLLDAAARHHRPRRHRRGGPRHRDGRVAAGRGEGLPDRRRRGEGAAPDRGEPAPRGRRQRPGGPADPGPDRLRPRHGASGQGGRRGRHRHHRASPWRGDRHDRGARRRDRAGGSRAAASDRITGTPSGPGSSAPPAPPGVRRAAPPGELLRPAALGDPGTGQQNVPRPGR